MLYFYQKRYKEIMESDHYPFHKDKMLAVLMTMMEKEYKIPMIRYTEWEEQNKEVIDLYNTIVNSRNLYEG